MTRRTLWALLFAAALMPCLPSAANAEERAFSRVWGGAYNQQDWERFYHYPYVFYPQNYWVNEYYRSSESMYYRYPPEMRIPIYNKKWHNEYPQPRRYHWGHHFVTDIF